MFLSRIALNGALRDTMKLMASPNMLHGAVEGCFAGARGRNLWRVDYLGDQPYLLIVSAAPPNCESVAARYGQDGPAPCWEVKSYDPLLSRLEPGQIWRFRLRANPTRSSAADREGARSRGRLYNHVTEEQQKQWLIARGAAHGFVAQDAAFNVVNAQWHRFRRSGHDVTLLAVTFEGMLTVVDAALFQGVLTTGIGRGKAYGCGLMTIARAEGL